MRVVHRTRGTRHRRFGDETAQQRHPRTKRSQSIDGRQEVRIIVKIVQRQVNQVTEQIKTPQIQCAENRDPQSAKTVEFATGAVHLQYRPQSPADH